MCVSVCVCSAQQSCDPATACATPLLRTHRIRQRKGMGTERDQQGAKGTRTEAEWVSHESQMGAKAFQMESISVLWCIQLWRERSFATSPKGFQVRAQSDVEDQTPPPPE